MISKSESVSLIQDFFLVIIIFVFQILNFIQIFFLLLLQIVNFLCLPRHVWLQIVHLHLQLLSLGQILLHSLFISHIINELDSLLLILPTNRNEVVGVVDYFLHLIRVVPNLCLLVTYLLVQIIHFPTDQYDEDCHKCHNHYFY